MENKMKFPQKYKNGTARWLSIYLKELKSKSQTPYQFRVHCGVIPNSQHMEMTDIHLQLNGYRDKGGSMLWAILITLWRSQDWQ